MRKQVNWHHGSKVGDRVKAGTFRAALESLPDGPIRIAVEADIEHKSRPQNNYLHFLFGEAAKHMNAEGYGTGVPWTKELVKQYCKSEGLYPLVDVVIPKTGEIRQLALDTHELDKLDTMATIERVIEHFASEHGITLPAPDEQTELKLTA